ncbi:AMP-binding protein [Nocardia sp. NPDC052566]|uniref:AMP-binding protein n=1 Tax=Nocardia sp. NPDC052566 TaxID=3364330 RepID=UPI0037C9DF3E
MVRAKGRPLGNLLWEWAEEYGRKVAVRDGARVLSYHELAYRADALGYVMATRGLGPGARVLFQLPNGWELVVALLACQRIGVAPILTLTAHRAHDLARIAEIVDISAIFTVDSYKGHDHQADAVGIAQRAGRACPVFVAGASLRASSIDLWRACDYSAADIEPIRRALDRRAPAIDDDAVVLLSGGTTGRPKLVPHTHRDYAFAFTACAAASGVDDSTIFLAVLPVSHNFSLASPGILGVLDAGGTVVLGRSPSPDPAFEAIGRHAVTMSAIVPAVARRWLEYAESSTSAVRRSLSTLRVLQIGGAVTPPDLAARVEAELDVTVQQVYGMSEGLVCMTALDDPAEIKHHTQGTPVGAGDEVRIAGDGAIGEVLTRGPSTVRGYLLGPARVGGPAFTGDGWYRTGDLARKRSDGRIEIAGRIKDLVNRGGEKISVVEVETLLLGLTGVTNAAAVSLPHPELGECVGAALVCAADTTVDLVDVRKYFAEHGIAAHKAPDAVFVVDGIPTTGMGKVDRTALREKLAAISGSAR